jgi:hypothetical protein
MKLATAFAVAIALALPASTGASGQRVLGIDWTILGMRLGWYDPSTLTRLPGRTVPLVNHEGPWSVSPGGTRLALSGRAGDVRFIDLRRMRTLGVVELNLKAPPSSVTWLPRGRLLVTGGTSVVLVDTQGLHVLGRAKLPGVVAGLARVDPLGACLLLAPSGNGFAAAKVAMVGPNGDVRPSTLDRVTIGYRSSGDRFDLRTAGFAVDPATQRAFVVGTDDTIAVVDLRTLGVEYHDATSRYAAKPLPGPERTARWLGNGLLAVAGRDGPTVTSLKIVDTRDWSTRLVDRSSENVAASGGVLVGSSWPSFAGYSLDGTRLYRFGLATGEDIQIAGRYGYVCAGAKLTAVLDMTTGAPASPTHGATCVTVLKR